MHLSRIVAFVLACIACAACDGKMSALHEAAATGDAKTVREWIAKKRNLDIGYDEQAVSLENSSGLMRGVTPLMLAARLGQLENARLLVEGGANIYAEARPRDEQLVPDGQRNAFDYAVDNAAEGKFGNGAQIAAYLWSKSDGVRFGGRLARQIEATCLRSCNDRAGGDARSNAALLLIGIAPDEPRGRGISNAACFSNRPMEVLAFLEKNGVKFPKNTLHCSTFRSSHLRSSAERIAIAAFFLDHGADIEMGTGSATPLMGAASNENLEMVKFLLSRGANPNTRDAAGFNALSYAANHCTYGASVEVLEPKMQPLRAVVEELVKAGTETKVPDKGAEILRQCCSRQPQAPSQRQICQVFGL